MQSLPRQLSSAVKGKGSRRHCKGEGGMCESVRLSLDVCQPTGFDEPVCAKKPVGIKPVSREVRVLES